MTFQWTAVAAFLYAEIVILLILCLPIISPMRWQKVFTIRIWSKLANYWNKAFLTIIVLLIVLFLDAVREVRKYSSLHSSDKTPHTSSPNAFDHIQMKLFRAQRNLYISGFSLFLWLVLRRTVSLITMLAKEMKAQMTVETEIASTSEKAKKYLEENENLKKALKGKKTCNNESLSDAENEEMKQKVENLKEELKKMSHGCSQKDDDIQNEEEKAKFTQCLPALINRHALTKKSDEVSEVKKQCEYLKREYDHLTKEHQKMLDHQSEKPEKKAL